MIYLWWGLGIWCVFILIVGVFMYLRDARNRPHCPVHGCAMHMWGEEQDRDEYLCPVKDCGWCCDQYEDGKRSFFKP